ncbi:MAG: MBL fold metallo-hydrolase [Candidatus Jordarchaeaceae archaeon]
MEIIILGSGDTVGTPKLNCNCETCTLARTQGIPNARTRFGILIRDPEKDRNIAIDTGPDLRAQLIREGINRIAAVLYTHHHYDHILGFSEFYRVQNFVKVFGLKETLDFVLEKMGFKIIKAKRMEIKLYEPVNYHNIQFQAFPVHHPSWNEERPIQPIGYSFDINGKKLVITSDTGVGIPEESLRIMRNPDILITDAFIDRPTHFLNHHMTVNEAIELADNLKAKKTVLVHLAHMNPPHEKLQEKVDRTREKILVGYDSLKLVL